MIICELNSDGTLYLHKQKLTGGFGCTKEFYDSLSEQQKQMYSVADFSCRVEEIPKLIKDLSTLINMP